MTLTDPNYTPRRLLAHVCEALGVRTWKDLAAVLGVERHGISGVANRHRPMPPSLIVSILDAVPEMTMARLRELAGLPRANSSDASQRAFATPTETPRTARVFNQL
jgi:hypothetical protein